MRFERALDPIVTLAFALGQEPENLVVPRSGIPCEHVQQTLDCFPDAISIASHSNLLRDPDPIKLRSRLTVGKCSHAGSRKIRVLVPA
jgi:hypothetical protein